MDDTAVKIILGLAGIIITWTHLRVSSAHTKIDDDRRAVGKRFSKLDSNLSHCRQEIDKDMATHMSETQIKDFVDRSIKPVIRLVETGNAATAKLNDKFDDMNASMASIATVVKSIADKK